ncbi:integral membrane sensor signal transduction histidine kinase [Paenibacillus curdlanolyticus YK9]|uniref:histidine kinase n=1 Tax=Paenibacillus curdlanolyticus YK9 TaxID=717606 RepID=E0I858_9BACL|nr:HAMP domain-containing sensor histidine kinase [Paenibacillus curdlanolyticus]EFM11363.1 integral membrane sensor signal transduction histidine kinase [Paenibacillus curdlanolyticus YK9]
MKRPAALQTLKRLLLPRSLRSQLLARSLFILAALLILIGAFQYVIMRDFLYQNQAETMMSELRNIPKELFGENPNMPRMPHGDGPDKGNYGHDGGYYGGPVLFMLDKSLALVGSDGTFSDVTADKGIAAPQLTQAEYAAIRSKPEQRRHGRIPYQVATAADGTEQLLVFVETGPGQEGFLQLGQKTEPLKELLLRQLSIFAALSLLALAGGLLLYLPVLRRTLRPLNRMVRTVEQTDAGSLNERLPANQGQLEIDLLAESFNGMLGRLETSFEAEREAKEHMRRFIADASHELRTPLTSIHGFLEVLLRGAADKREQLYPALNSMHGESTRMKKLVEDLLMLAKMDRAPQLRMSPILLDELMEEMDPHLRMLAGERTVQFELQQAVSANGDADQIKQVVLNLFHNAVQHTDAHSGIIQVTVSDRPAGQPIVSITDNGPGIAAEHVPHVFERFYRSDSSRTRKHGGAGLGLSISQSIVKAHGGEITVDSVIGRGSTFAFKLPASKP